MRVKDMTLNQAREARRDVEAQLAGRDGYKTDADVERLHRHLETIDARIAILRPE